MEFLSTFWRSFWSPQAYKNALYWRWKSVAYFFLLSFFVAIITSIAARPYYKDFIDNQLKVALSEMASFDVVDGKIKTPEGKNYAYELPNGVGFLSVSETLNPSPFEYFISIEGDKAVILSETFSLSELLESMQITGDTTIDKASVFKFLDDAWSLYFFVSIPLLFASAIITNLFFVVILSVAAYTMLMNSPLRLLGFGYFASVKLSVLAITPMVLLQSIGTFVSLEDAAGFMYGIISIFLIWYVIKKLPAYFEEDTEEDTASE